MVIVYYLLCANALRFLCAYLCECVGVYMFLHVYVCKCVNIINSNFLIKSCLTDYVPSIWQEDWNGQLHNKLSDIRLNDSKGDKLAMIYWRQGNKICRPTVYMFCNSSNRMVIEIRTLTLYQQSTLSSLYGIKRRLELTPRSEFY